jgi:uncharacterized protein YciI
MIGHDGPNGSYLRDENRDEHVAYIAGLDRDGRIQLAGPIRSESDEHSVGVVIVFTAPGMEEARAVVEADPYVRAGVFASITVAPFKRVFPATT